MKKILSLVIVIAILFSCIPVHALEMSDLANVQDEAALRAAVRGDELWVANYPNGLFNFVGTQYMVNENNNFLEIAIARQGGTTGDVSVDFKAIDISARYGTDYVIRVYENSAKMEMKKNENAIPLIDTLKDNAELNISEPEQDNASEVEQKYIDLESKMVKLDDNNKSDSATPKSLKELREAALGQKSNRPDWKEVDRNTIEQLKADYDEFFYNVPGTETTINFKDGEYIKYLYIVLLNDDISESEEQILFALTNPTGGAVRGEFYMAYANIKDDESFEASSFEIADSCVYAQNGKASVVVRRIGGVEQYASVYVGTEAGTAVPGADYVPGLQELFFTPGMTEQTVTVNLLNNPNRSNDRIFKIALDRRNKNVNLEKAEAIVIIPAEINLNPAFNVDAPQLVSEFQKTSALPASSGMTGLSEMAAAESIMLPNPIYNIYSANKISGGGFSPEKGKWNIVAQDFLSGTKTGTAYDELSNLRLSSNGGSSSAVASNIKLYGVESVSFDWSNSGCGRHWTTHTTEYDNWWDKLWGINGRKVEHPQSEHAIGMTFAVTAPGPGNFILKTRSENQGWKQEIYNINGSLWNTSAIGFSTLAAEGNQSTVKISPVSLNLKEYQIKVSNDVTNVPKFKLKKYIIENENLKEYSVLLEEQPGNMKIKSVYSSVNNGRDSVNSEQVGAFRSDKVEFSISYADNEIGNNSSHLGYEVKIGNTWKRYTGTSFALDEKFFSQSGAIAELEDGIIEVRPVFAQKEADITLKADINNGYIIGLKEKTSEKKFSELKIGDVISASARNYNSSITPSWSANNMSVIVKTDNTGANISVDYKLNTQSNWLRVDFINPTLIVQANPNVYKYNVSKPIYTIDGVTYKDYDKDDDETYADLEELRTRMEAIYEVNTDDNPGNNVNPSISLTFSYVFDENYPDPKSEAKNAFGTSQKAILTVYKSDGTVRGIYPSIKDQNSPASYNVTASNGTYTYSGKLADLGWEKGDYATVIIYGSEFIGNRPISTRENVIDFLTNSGNGITVKKPDEEILAGDIYNPVIIEKADPIESYEMTSYLAPGYVAKWKDYSGDFDGDGQVVGDEYLKLERKMQSYGMNLDNIYSKPEYKYLFWGNFFSYTPKYFNPSKILYNFEKAPVSGESCSATIIVIEKFSTILNPSVSSTQKPVADATVIVGNKSCKTDKDGKAVFYDPMFEEGKFYLARVLHKGYEYYTYVEGGGTVKAPFDTSNVMRPYELTATFRKYEGNDLSAPEPIEALKNYLLPVKNGIAEFKFRVDSRNEGIAANDAIIRVYETKIEGENEEKSYYRTNKVYESRVGGPEGGIFTHSIDLLAQKIKAGNVMTISPLYTRDGEIVKEYPEVEAGFTFSRNLTLISMLASFDTPLSPTLQFIGELNNSFDLGMDIDMDSKFEEGTRKAVNGDTYKTKYIKFGFNKEFDKKFGDQKDDSKDEKVTDKLKGEVGHSSGSDEKGKTQNAVKNNTGSPNQNPKKLSTGGTLNFSFGVSLALTIEQGQDIVNGITTYDGEHYFSSLILMAEGKADFSAKATYVTPIGIPVFATINMTGSASVIFGIEANDSERYVEKYQFSEKGKIPLNPNEYSIYTKFFVSPSITIGAGVGMDYLNLYLEGNAVFDFNFTVPIIGENASSEGSGGVILSAAVGIKVLFIEKKWTIYQSDRFDFFNYGNAPQAMMAALNNPYKNHLYEPVTAVSEEDIIPRDYLENSSGWLPGRQMRALADFSLSGINETDETRFMTGAYPYPQTKMVSFGDGKLLVLFISDPGRENRDDLNRAQLFYTIYAGDTWSVPVAIDNDNTWDEAPDAFAIDDKILITWSDAGRQFTTEDTAVTTLNTMNISARWFDTLTGEFNGSEFSITKDTIVGGKAFDDYPDVNPRISYDPATERLMVYYTKIDYLVGNDSEAVYGDIANGYNVITFRYAEKQQDGSFNWNTTYKDGEIGLPGYTKEELEEGFYGQRFLDLSVLVDIQETEVEKAPMDPIEDGEGKPEGWENTVIGTEQIVTTAENPNTDPLVVYTDLITYNGLALYSYVIDNDGSKSTTNDQELYMQIYNYELNEFHHPIRLTNNAVQDTKPQFVRSKNITYLYWISGGNIVYMDITNLVKHNLLKKEVVVDGKLRSLYIIDKSYTGINGFINTAIECIPDYPIEDFRLQSNDDSEYLIWTEYVISYKNGLKAGEPGTEDPNNINKEKQIFAAYREPQVGYTTEQVFDYFKDTGDLRYIYADGKGTGTYPTQIEALKDVIGENSTVLIYAGEIITIDYKTMPDINGYKGVIKAGDPVMLQKYGSCEGYRWSTPIQLTKEAGANYSDISFVVNDDDNIQAAYIKYNQILNESGSFVNDISNRTFALREFNIISTVEASEIALSEELPLANSNLNFSEIIKNTGIKPITHLKYQAYMKQNDEEISISEAQDILDSDINIVTGEPEKMILGGDTAKLTGAFQLPEDITNLAIGFRIFDKDENVLLETEKAVRAEANLDIAVTGSELTGKNTANLSFNITNLGNVKFEGKLDIITKSDSKLLKSIELDLNPGENEKLNVELNVDDSMFGGTKTADDGSVSDKIELVLKAGEYSKNTEIRRAAEKSVVDMVNNVKSFSVESTRLSIYEGSVYKLNANTTLYEPIPENTADPMGVKWKTSNADVASVLPDGTIIGLSAGSAVITATLLPKDNTFATSEDGSIISIDNSYKLPANMIQERRVNVKVFKGAGDTIAENPVQPDEIKQSDEAVVIGLIPEVQENTSTLKPKESAVTEALQKLGEENKSTLIFAALNQDGNKNSDIEISKLIVTAGILSAIAGSEASKVVFETPMGKMALEKETINRLNQLVQQAGENHDITIQISRADSRNYPADLEKLIGNRPVYDFSIMIGNKNLRDITDDPIPFTLELDNMPREDPSTNENQIVGAYITEDGKYKLIPLSALVDGKLAIKTTHNSLYGGLYNNVQFDDVSGWSENFIAFLSARGIISGKGNNKFDPKNYITRAEFVKIMAVIADAEIDTGNPVKPSFKDVNAGKWYAPYIEWAYTARLIDGIGNGMFAPDKNITREDMAVLISRFAEKLGYQLPELYGQKVFKDNADIAGYAMDSVKLIQKAGIIQGKPNGVFAPKDNATREETARVFTALIKLIV